MSHVFVLCAEQMLKKISLEERVEDRSTAELDALKHRDWVRWDGGAVCLRQHRCSDACR